MFEAGLSKMAVPQWACWLCRNQLSYAPGADEQHKGELTKARQYGIELLETWLILEYCNCGSLEEAMLEGKYSNDLVSPPPARCAMQS